MLGKDLRRGDVMTDCAVVRVGEARTITAAVLCADVARQHPGGLPGRTVYVTHHCGGGVVGMTVFDDELYEVSR